jgi:hypothetical protein
VQCIRRLPPPFAAACAPGAPCFAASPLLPSPVAQGVQDTVLEADLPEVSVNDRALAINALLSSLKLQVGRCGAWSVWWG